VKTLVKICGLSDERGLKAAVDGGAAFVGFNFFRRSPRYVTPEQAGELAALVPRGVKAVGLVVNPTDAELENIVNAVQLDMIQLHGDETPERVDAIKALTGLKVIKVIGVSQPRDLIDAQAFEGHADWLLFDAKPPKAATRPGGNAVAFDWLLMKTYVGKTPWMLAGGLLPANVTDAIRASGAGVVDVASGVETKPGVKSPAKIRAFLQAVRSLAK
jgi:phosphoribosylanthranilate isomerase